MFGRREVGVKATGADLDKADADVNDYIIRPLAPSWLETSPIPSLSAVP